MPARTRLAASTCLRVLRCAAAACGTCVSSRGNAEQTACWRCARCATRPAHAVFVRKHHAGELKTKRSNDVADAAVAQADENGRSPGVAPAVAARLEAVLALCALKSGAAARTSKDHGASDVVVVAEQAQP